MIKKFLTLFIIMIATLSSIASADVFQGTMLRDSITLKSGVDITATGGASDFDYSASTGFFKFPSGIMTMTKGASIPAGENIVMIAGDGYLTVGTGGINSTSSPITMRENVAMADGKNITTVGTGKIILGAGGITATASPITMQEDVTLAANKSISMSGASSGFATGGGVIALNGDTTILAGKDLGMSGSATFTTGTGAIALNGNTTLASAKNLSMSGASSFVVGTIGIDSSGSTLNLLDDVALAINKDIGMSGTATFTTGTGSIGLNGPTTLADTLAFSVNATTTINTTLSSINTKTVYGIDASAGSKALILPDAATVSGRLYMISTTADPGAYNVTITATGGDTIGVAASKVTTTPAGMTLVSDGTRYLEVGSYGTWT